VFYCYLEFHRTNKVHKPSDFEKSELEHVEMLRSGRKTQMFLVKKNPAGRDYFGG
jgi:hypothetical protein